MHINDVFSKNSKMQKKQKSTDCIEYCSEFFPKISVFVFAIFCQTEADGGSQDHLVCLHPLIILKDQSHIRKVLGL